MEDIEDLVKKYKNTPNVKMIDYKDRQDQFMMHFCREQHLIKSSKDFDKLVTSLRRIYRTNLSKNEMKDWINNYDKNINDIVSRCLVKKATRSQSGVLVATITLSPHKFSCTENVHIVLKKQIYREIILNQNLIHQQNLRC